MSPRLVLAAALALLVAPARAAAAPCVETLCGAAALAPFLAELKASRVRNPQPFHILQIGDSHTAGDNITGSLRRRLQETYGHAGRGVLAPGRPYRGYLTRDVTAGQTEGWTVYSTFGRSYAPEGPPIGLSGYTLLGRRSGEMLWFTTDAGAPGFDRLVVCAIAQPGGGTVRLRLSRVEQYWDLQAPRRSADCRTLEDQSLSAYASVEIVEQGLVGITSFGLFRRIPGIALSNLGVPGSQLQHLARMSDDVVAAELSAYRPDLIVLAFGTNEGFSPVLTAGEAETSLRTQVARIRRLAGRDVPILLLGAPDAAAWAPAGAGRLACGDGWHVPALLERVRERQAAAARELGLAYWDWAAAMGGRCATSRWVAGGLMRGDHVHFTRAGGDHIAAMLESAFNRAVDGAP
jgi:lysophospholipase L1-like esterase